MPGLRKILGGLSFGMAALLLGATAGAAQARVDLGQVKLRAFKPVCSATQIQDVMQAVSGASQLLEERCRLRLLWQGVESLPLESAWCHLPIEASERSKALKDLAARAKGRHRQDLGLYLLPTRADERLSWAIVDASRMAACNSPQDPRFLSRFGHLFFTDLTWMQGAPRAGQNGPSQAALLVAHEVLHALTQRAHPTGAERGSVLADHVADIGPAIDDELCACARQSPYASPLKGER